MATAVPNSRARRPPWCTSCEDQRLSGSLSSALIARFQTDGVLTPRFIVAGFFAHLFPRRCVGPDDLLHQSVSEHIRRLHVDEGDSIDALQHLLDLDQSRDGPP